MEKEPSCGGSKVTEKTTRSPDAETVVRLTVDGGSQGVNGSLFRCDGRSDAKELLQQLRSGGQDVFN